MTDDSDDTTEVELENVDYSDIDDKAMTVFEKVAESVEQPVTQVIDNLPRMGIDPTEITEDQAERFLKAEENEDPEEFDEVLEDLGVPEQIRDQMVDGFRSNLDGGARPDDENDAAGDTELDASPSTNPSNGNTSETPSRAEIQQMIRRETPDAEDIAGELQQQMGGAGGQDGGMTTQQQMALQMAKQFLGPSGGGGAMEGAVSQAEEQMKSGMAQAMGNMAKSMAQPSLGQRVGQAIDSSMAESIAENMEIQIGGEAIDVSPTEGEDDEESSDSSGEE